VSVPICQANILFDGTNTHTVRQCLNRQKNTSNITKHFFEDLFFAHMTATNEQEALQFLSNALEQHEKLSGNFYSLVSQREKLARTSFGNKAAFPHPIRPIGKRTVVAVGLLDYPVDWSGLPVRAIFLSSFAEKDDGIRDFDRNMASFLLDEEAINSLLDHQSYDNLLNLLTHYSDASPEKLAPEQTATQTDVPITS
jgi:lichenan operon transcriptional antiterminator